MADYRLNQPGATIQEAIDIALEIQGDLADEVAAREAADALLATKTELQSEASARQAADAEKASITQLTGETSRAQAAESALGGRIDAIDAKIPSAASESNQLADRNFVNSSIGTSTANYIGNNGEPFTSVAQLNAYTGPHDNNDYAFVVSTDAAGNTVYSRYKYNGSTWAKEYDLNNSSFTAAQWAAINSLMTAAKTQKLDALPTASELTTLFSGKQDVIDDLATIRAQAAAAYVKPSGGIPASDIAEGVIPDVSGKVNTSDIADNLTTDDATMVLSAKQGKVLNENLTQLGQKVGKVAIPITKVKRYIKTNTGVGNAIGAETYDNSFSYLRYPVSPGDTIIVNGTGGGAPRLWCFIDSNQIILSVADTSITASNLKLTAPTNAAEVIINTNVTSIPSYYIAKESSEALFEGIENEINGTYTYITVPVTQGTQSLSRVNLYNGASLPKGTKIKLKVVQAVGLLSKIMVVNSSWHPELETTNFVDGQEFDIILKEDVTSLGLYSTQDVVVGTGTVKVYICTDYAASIKGQLEETENNEKVFITCKREGVSGVDADFCGLNAIGDAVASIEDALESKQYYICIDGHFLFTNPKMEADGGDFKYSEGGEFAPLIAKKWVHFIGIDKSRAVVEVRLDPSLVSSDFPTGKTFTDYQAAYIRQSCHIKNMTFIGTNVRYTMHIEKGEEEGANIHLEDCAIVSRTSTKGYKSSMVIGEIPYFKLKVERCDFTNENGMTNSLFGGHTPLNNINNGRENCLLEFADCSFLTAGKISIGTFAYNRQDKMVFRGCKFHPKVRFNISANSESKRQIGTLIDIKGDMSAFPFYSIPREPQGLRVTAISGSSSSVRFDPTCTAFAIVGNASEKTQQVLSYSAIKTYGYEYKDDPQGSHAYACGWVNIDPTTGNSLGSILGDCSGTSKTLTITVNGTDYDVVFSTNLTNETNENIIAAINAVIGSVALCDTYNPELQQYPDFDGEEYFITSGDSTVIEKGMGVVKIDSGVIRRAKQSDGYIDGIAVDIIYPGQAGRIITRGKLWSVADGDGSYYLSINPVLPTTTYGANISIDANNDGKFIVSDDAPVLRSLKDTIVEIL